MSPHGPDQVIPICKLGYNMASCLGKCYSKLQRRKEIMTDNNSITTIPELMQTVPSLVPTPTSNCDGNFFTCQ